MPAFITHRVAGERVLEKLKKSAVAHKMAFYLGCQGPDMLFFRNYQPWRSAKDSLSLGVAMHSEKTRELMQSALDFARGYEKDDKDELVSYIAGFITHYAIDKNAHPFVYSKAGKDSHAHHMLEFMWDSYSAKEQWDMEPGQFDIYPEVMYGDIGSGICDWYKTAAKDVYGRDIPAGMIKQSQKHFAKAKSSLANLSFPGKILIKIISVAAGFDARTMTYPKQRDESMFSKEEYVRMRGMISKGVNEAIDMIGFALNYIKNKSCGELPRWFGDTDFAGDTVYV
ncbi:MAG: zinc dependent phospholipase C family protein [Eubacteriales bacterium]|nr:zinc dependent phospholipase C family protein [Eubacteriales bacterium]